MILSYLSSGYSFIEILPILLLSIPTVIIALTVHEFSHGYVSYKLGDHTAYDKGRLTLNPLSHLDPIGTLCMFLFGFGWARPVPINAMYYKKRKLGVALTAAAGPLSNLILSFICTLLFYVIFGIYTPESTIGFEYNFMYGLFLFLQLGMYMNVGLAVFNLIPIPPLDGSRLLYAVLPDKIYFGIMRYEKYIYYALMAVIIFGNLFGFSLLSGPMSFLSDAILSFFMRVVSLIPIG